MASLLVYGIIMWFILVVIAVINGLVREKLVKPKTGDLIARQISCFTFILALLVATYVFLKAINLNSAPSEYLYLGLLWTAMTLIFEFGFGHFIMGHPWSKLLEDYNLLKGRLWILVLIATALAPYLMSKLI